jgi:hypothetical protein
MGAVLDDSSFLGRTDRLGSGDVLASTRNRNLVWFGCVRSVHDRMRRIPEVAEADRAERGGLCRRVRNSSIFTRLRWPDSNQNSRKLVKFVSLRRNEMFSAAYAAGLGVPNPDTESQSAFIREIRGKAWVRHEFHESA